MRKLIIGALVAAVGSLLLAVPAGAHHNSVDVTQDTGECGETTFTTSWVEEGSDSHQVGNTVLVVQADGTQQDASVGEDVTVGPFTDDTTVRWRVWGGGERDYDSPPLDDLDALVDYLGDHPGGELDLDPPGVAWHEFEVEGCPEPEPEPTEEPIEEPIEEPTEEPGDDQDQNDGDDQAPIPTPTRIDTGAGGTA